MVCLMHILSCSIYMLYAKAGNYDLCSALCLLMQVLLGIGLITAYISLVSVQFSAFGNVIKLWFKKKKECPNICRTHYQCLVCVEAYPVGLFKVGTMGIHKIRKPEIHMAGFIVWFSLEETLHKATMHTSPPPPQSYLFAI